MNLLHLYVVSRVFLVFKCIVGVDMIVEKLLLFIFSDENCLNEYGLWLNYVFSIKSK